VQAFGSVADVLQEFDEVKEGRIRLHGSDWPALSHDGKISKGEKVKVIGRENLIWMVEKIDGGEPHP
jgi:membrane-bound ClpP family serine protease